MDRDRFLQRIAARLRTAALHEAAPALSVLPVDESPAECVDGYGATRDRDGMVRLFSERLRELGGATTLVPSREDAYASIAQSLHAKGLTTVACPPLLGEALMGGLQVRDVREAGFGLSEADWGIAETGTVVLRHQGEHGRGYSLVPPAVGFLLPVSRLVPHLGVVLAAVHEAASGPPACITFVSGPSHSGDIAGIFCAGVHGPGDVHVWLIGDE